MAKPLDHPQFDQNRPLGARVETTRIVTPAHRPLVHPGGTDISAHLCHNHITGIERIDRAVVRGLADVSGLRVLKGSKAAWTRKPLRVA